VGLAAAAGPFRPVLRGMLVAGDGTYYLRRRLERAASDDVVVSEQPLWWPPNRLCGRYLAPYLSSVASGAAMFQAQARRPISHTQPDGHPVLAELADL
jgi:hypothetical protein